jgi:hypothetical protein
MNNQFKKTALRILFVLFFISNLNAQNSKSSFEIKFYLNKNRIAIENVNGNNWNTMFIKSNSFNLNQNGMVTIENNQDAYSKSNYIFSVVRKKNKVNLLGKKGTKWEKLFFELPNKESYVIVTESGIKS